MRDWEAVEEPPDDLDNSGAARHLIRAAVDAGADSMQKETVINFTYEHANFNKTTLRDAWDELASESAEEDISFRNVRKILHEDPDREATWLIDIEYDGEVETFRGPSKRLLNPGSVSTWFLEKYDEVVHLGNKAEWADVVDHLLDEVEIEEVMEDPNTTEHNIFESAITTLSKSDVVFDQDEFERRRNTVIYYDEDDDSVYVASKFLENVATDMNAVSWDAVRAIAENRDYLKNGTEEPVQEWRRVRVWNFSPAQLIESGHVEPDQLNPEQADG